jgi:hypothetical protein
VRPEATKQAVAAADFIPSYTLNESVVAEMDDVEEKSTRSKAERVPLATLVWRGLRMEPAPALRAKSRPLE